MGKKYYNREDRWVTSMGTVVIGSPGGKKFTGTAHAQRQARWRATPPAKQLHPLQALRKLGGQVVRDWRRQPGMSDEEARAALVTLAKKVGRWVEWARESLIASGGRYAQNVWQFTHEQIRGVRP